MFLMQSIQSRSLFERWTKRLCIEQQTSYRITYATLQQPTKVPIPISPIHQNKINKRATGKKHKHGNKPNGLYKYHDTTEYFPPKETIPLHHHPNTNSIHFPDPTEHLPEDIPTPYLEDNNADNFDDDNKLLENDEEYKNTK